MITTERAAQKLQQILIQRFLGVGLGFRILGNADESGHTTFDIKLDNERPGDEVIETHDMKVFLDQKSAALLSDCELDYLDEPAAGFVIKPTNDQKA